jgi:hypothetical protein
MKPIGGFFELELPQCGTAYHKNAIPLSTGRACLNLIIQETIPKKIYIPYYTCDVLLDPIIINHIPFEYYEINSDLEPKYPVTLGQNEYFLYINYFGIKTRTANALFKKYKNNYILDNTHAFFEKDYIDIWAFNSARKFFGVPDGAYLYSPYPIKKRFKKNSVVQYDHLINRLLGKQKLAYRQFLQSEKLLTAYVYAMSEISEKILRCLNYSYTAKTRKENFNYLHEQLKQFNQLKIDSPDKCVPYCYPFLPKHKLRKEIFYNEAIYIPELWKRTKRTRTDHFQFEKDFAKSLLPLPIDQRYSKNELNRMVNLISNLLSV